MRRTVQLHVSVTDPSEDWRDESRLVVSPAAIHLIDAPAAPSDKPQPGRDVRGGKGA